MSTTQRAVILGGAIGLVALVLLFVSLRQPRAEPTSPVPPTRTPSTATSGADASPSATTTGEPVTTDGPATSEPSPPASVGPVAVMVGAGDISECDNDRDAATADLLEDVEGIVFTLGDNAYERGSLREFRECYDPTWGRPSILGRTRPVAGNHEYNTPDAAGYFEYFGAAAGDPDEGWYAFDAGAWRVYALNSNCSEIGGCEAGSPQERWLRDDLAANPRTCVAALAHHPRFSSGDHGDNEVMTDIWRALQDAGAELLLAGHDHSYERFAPQDAAGRPDERGLVEIVVGTGGRDPYPFRDTKDNSVVRATPVFGVLRLELGPDSYAFQFLAIEGTEFADSGSGSCH